MSVYASNILLPSQKQEKRTRLSDGVQLICLLYISVWAISPPLAFGDLYRVIAIATTVVWLGVELVIRPRNLLQPSLPTFFALFYILYTALIDLTLFEIEDILKHFQIYIFLLFLIFYESYRKRDFHQLRIVLWIALGLLSVWSLITIKELLIYPHVSRLLVRSSPMAEYYMAKGVGGYGLVYSAVVAVPILAYILKSRHLAYGILGKVAGYLMIFACLLLIMIMTIKAGYTIALVLMIGSILIFVTVNKRSLPALFFSVLFIFILFILMSMFADTTIHFLSELGEGTAYERKIQDIEYSVEIERSVGTVNTRSERYMRSIGLFFENPILGTLSFTEIGKHSSILDQYARYGIFVGSIFIYLVFCLPLHYLNHSSKSYGVALAVLFITIGFSLLNNLTISFGFMIFIFYPVAMTYFENEKSRFRGNS